MTESKQMLFAKNLVCVCVENAQDEDFSGLLYHQYADDPIQFNSAMDLLIKMDKLMDDWDVPQKGLADRYFRKEHAQQEPHHPDPANSDDERLPIEVVQDLHGVRNIQNKKGRLGTFVIQVVYRQDATWQGHVIHQEENEKQDFRSALALIKYIDSSIGQKN